MSDVNEVKKGNGDSKKITITLVLILVLMVSTTGGTYAYLVLSGGTAANNITGNVASGSLSFSAAPSIIAPAVAANKTKPMVPQYAFNNSKNTLQLALNGASGKDKCVDGNDNVICKAFAFTIKNENSATVKINGAIKFAFTSGSSIPNLKWKLMTSGTTVAATAGDNSANAFTTAAAGTNFATNVSLAPQATATYNFIVWIQETGAVQSDTGTWLATIMFTSSAGGGITSTITG